MLKAHIQQTPGSVIVVYKDPGGHESRDGGNKISVDEMRQPEDKGIAEHEQVFLRDQSLITVKIVHAVNDLLRKNRCNRVQKKSEDITVKVLHRIPKKK